MGKMKWNKKLKTKILFLIHKIKIVSKLRKRPVMMLILAKVTNEFTHRIRKTIKGMNSF